MKFSPDQFLKTNSQSIYLMGVSVLNVVLGFAINLLLAKMLSPTEYGDFYYILNLYTLFSIILSFGVFYSCSQQVIKFKEKKSIQNLYGIMSIFIAIACVAVCTAIYFYSQLSHTSLSSPVGRLLILFSPACIIFLLSQFFETVLPAGNSILLLAKTRIYPRIAILLFFWLFFLVNYQDANILRNLLAAYLIISATIAIALFMSLKPSFENFNNTLKKLLAGTKAYGLNLYIGSIFSVGGTAFAAISVGYLGKNNIEVGFFSLATSFCVPLSIISSSISASNFRKFASQRCLSGRLFIVNAVILAVFAILISILSGAIILKFWGEEYKGAAQFVYVLSIASVLYGVSDLITRYLAANGRSRELRNSSFLVGGALILGTIFCVDKFGGIGAAYSRVVAGLVYLISISIFYFDATRKSDDNKEI